MAHKSYLLLLVYYSFVMMSLISADSDTNETIYYVILASFFLDLSMLSSDVHNFGQTSKSSFHAGMLWGLEKRRHYQKG